MSCLVVAKQKAHRQTDTGSKVKNILFYFIFQTSKLYYVGHCFFLSFFLLVGHTVNSQWFLEQVENVNIKHYIKHSLPDNDMVIILILQIS